MYCIQMLQTVRQAGNAQRQHAAALMEEVEVGGAVEVEGVEGAVELEGAVASLPTTPPTPQWARRGYCHAVWGAEHPDIKKTGAKRALWSVAEKDWIHHWIQSHPGKETAYARCLADINGDPSARDIFHPLHVLDSKRIRSGFEAVVK